MEERKELGIGTRNKKERKNREVKQCNSYLNVFYNPYPFPISTTPLNQLTTYLTPWPNQLTTHNSSTIAVQLSCTSHCTHPHTHPCKYTCTTLHTHTHTPPPYTPLHNYNCHTYLQISTIAYNTPLSPYNTYHTNQVL